jgi:hypothetical protein
MCEDGSAESYVKEVLNRVLTQTTSLTQTANSSTLGAEKSLR